MIAEQIEFLKIAVNALSVKLVALEAPVDTATAAHALGEVMGTVTGGLNVEIYVLALDAGVEVAREMKAGTRPCLACQAEGLRGDLHHLQELL